MADVVVTAANVARVSGEAPNDTIIDPSGYAGATITAGQTVYRDTNNLWQLADANVSATTAAVQGIALNGASANQPLVVAIGGQLNPGFTVTVGAVYVLSATPGGIAPVADLVTGWRTSVLGVGMTASRLALQIHRSGVAVP